MFGDHDCRKDKWATLLDQHGTCTQPMQSSTPTEAAQAQLRSVSYINDSILHIQSDKFSGGVPRFLIKNEDTIRFTIFHMGIRIKIPSLSKNKICVLVSWSAL